MDLLAPTILLSRVWIRGAKSMLISIYLIKIDAGFCFWTVKTDNKRIRGWAMLIKRLKGSGCGSVGRGPRFDSSHRQNFIEHLFVNLRIINCIEKTKINKKRLGMAHFLKIKRLNTQCVKFQIPRTLHTINVPILSFRSRPR